MSRILIVEDEPDIAAALQEDLRLEGHEVEVVGDGEAALERARSDPFDLVVLDVMLPGVDGVDVCRAVRQAGIETPIMLLTAKYQVPLVSGGDMRLVMITNSSGFGGGLKEM